MTNALTIELLNHASIIIQASETSLLCDPWLDGTCFHGRWGLRYRNPTALSRAISSTHLWISHFHGDHFHTPTLEQIAERVPHICALANVSANFDLREPLQRMGFLNIHPLPERRPLSIANGYEVVRYPATGSDNMLVMRTAGFTIVNFNDCNLPFRAIRSIVSKIGPVDVLLTSYNHAGKVLEYPSHQQVKETFRYRFQAVVEAINPRWVIPFASSHYYRSVASAHQNESLLTAEELVAAVPRTLPLNVGDRAVFVPGQNPSIEHPKSVFLRGPSEERQYEASVQWEQLMTAAKGYLTCLRRGFPGGIYWILPLAIRVEDLKRVFVLDPRNGVAEQDPTYYPVHLSAHSRMLFNWLERPFGASTFWIGADLEIVAEDVTPIRRIMLAGLLMENRLTLRDILRMLLRPRDWSFFLHRREEIAAMLADRHVTAGEARL